jgi:Cu+-exporting ATPase
MSHDHQMGHDHRHGAGNIDMATDPVCGMSVTADSAAAQRTIDGRTFRFCSAHCAATFDADPQRYTAASKPAP